MLRQPFEASRSTTPPPEPRSPRFFAIDSAAQVESLVVYQEPKGVKCNQDTGYRNRQEEPVSTHPEDGSRVIIVPRGAFVNGEKTPWVFVISMLLLEMGTRMTYKVKLTLQA